MDEKKWMDQIRKSADSVSAPDDLSPENIEAKLHEKADKKRIPFAGRAAWRKYGVRIAEAAAAVAIVFAAGHRLGTVQMREYMNGASDTKTESMTAENAAGETAELAEAAQDVEKAAGQAAAETKDTVAETKAADAQTKTADAETKDAAAKMKETAAKDAVPEEAASPATRHNDVGITPIGSEDALFEKLHEFSEQNGSLGYQGYNLYTAKDGVMEIAQEMEIAPADGGQIEETGNSQTGSPDFSRTNLRELGVDESDIVKTDGKFIYIIRHNTSVRIIGADGGEMKQIAVLQPEELNEMIRDMYVSDDRLILITTGNRSSMVESEKDIYTTQSYSYAKVSTYDITDRSNPGYLGSMEQEGYYHSSRKVGDHLYLFTEFIPQIKDTREESGIMPLVNGAYMKVDDVYVPESLEDTSYLVIGSMDIKRPTETLSHKAVVSGAEHFYVSTQSIYICSQKWENGTDTTAILKFSYKDGDIWGAGMTQLEGYLNDTFSLDEYNGYLRVVATAWDKDEINTLYVYDGEMELVGKIDDIAPGETIRSARFMGDIGYFVTFKQTDPLFSVDLSDPENPRILGELSVTGFSSYLHFYGEDRLLGVGYEADPETGMAAGVKLSMFDVSDPAHVAEIKRYVIKDADNCPGLSDYKAIMIDPEKNLFGFVCDEHYLLFTYDEQEGFRNLLTYSLSDDAEKGLWYGNAYADVRGLYISDTFYLADADMLRAFDMKNEFEQVQVLEL